MLYVVANKKDLGSAIKTGNKFNNSSISLKKYRDNCNKQLKSEYLVTAIKED